MKQAARTRLAGRAGATTPRGRARLAARLSAAALLVAVVPAGAASAHESGSEDADRAHAEQDLAGRSVTEVEQETRANRREIAAAGEQPQVDRQAAEGVGVAADPGQSGSWGPVVDTPLVPVFQAVLPDGDVLMWDSVGDGASESYSDHSFTRAMVWDPDSNTYERVDVQGYNIFCAGYTQLLNGDVLVAGGNKNANLDGIVQTHVFDWRERTWSRGPDMAAERWYPSVTVAANGEALIVAGGSDRAEVYQTNGVMRVLSAFSSYAERLYPFLVPRTDGRVEILGPSPTLGTMDIDGQGTLTSAGLRDTLDRRYGSFATITPDTTLVSGGSPDGENPTSSTVVVDTSGSSTAVRLGPSMALPRKQHNSTVLADGSVVVTGGTQTNANGGLVDLANPALAAERYDPATDSWTTLASAARVRQYHSTASLLPDGRVLTGGGGICGACVQNGYLEKNLETFTPPYLYRQDGSGELATRPEVTGVPASVSVGSSFTATSSTASDIRKVGLVRLGAPTHSVDQGQRYVPLDFTASGTTLSVTAPASTGLAPPGYYMMFAVDSAGVPSVADIVQVTG